MRFLDSHVCRFYKVMRGTDFGVAVQFNSLGSESISKTKTKVEK